MSALLKPAVPSSTEMLEAFGRLFCLGIGCGAGAGVGSGVGRGEGNGYRDARRILLGLVASAILARSSWAEA